MALQIDHANVVVRDLATTTAFYRDVLGFRVIQEQSLDGEWISTVVGAPECRMDCVILEAPGGGARLELLAYVEPAASELPGHGLPHCYGLRHLAFRVEDIDAVLARLQEADLHPHSEPVTVPFAVGGRRKRLLYFHGPEGVLLELCEYTDPTGNDGPAGE